MSDSGDPSASVGIIGGSGLYDIDDLEITEERAVETPFGDPSGPIAVGELGDRGVAFVPRHGEDHRYNPTTVPYRANIWALKSLGVDWIISVSAVGSLREPIAPGDLVIPDQIIDKTSQRTHTFYEDLAAHVGMSRPFVPMLRDVLLDAAHRTVDVDLHDGGTYVCMEGPAFSTIAESELHRQWGADLVGMTAIPEAKLAREAEIAYATLALPTDYDVWQEEGPTVQADDVLEILENSAERAKEVIGEAIPAIPSVEEADCSAHRALESALVTPPESIPDQTLADLEIFLSDYLD